MFCFVFLFETQCFWLLHDSLPMLIEPVWWDTLSHTTVMDLNGTSSATQASAWRSRIELQLASIIVPTTVLQRGQDRKCILHPVGFWEEQLPYSVGSATCLLPITAACLWPELRWLLLVVNLFGIIKSAGSPFQEVHYNGDYSQLLSAMWITHYLLGVILPVMLFAFHKEEILFTQNNACRWLCL